MVGRLEATVHHGIAEVAFLLGPEYWGRGYASQSLQWLHAYLAENLALRQYWAVTAPANWRCQKLLLRNGYCEQSPPEFPLYSYDPGDKIF
ncbi:MAG: GNAT family N-acetyltransferase [Verrucomicrobia bacterium]|nr:GNAT family N-acetyltransferase [Verrucomicrobiota bacterium]